MERANRAKVGHGDLLEYDICLIDNDLYFIKYILPLRQFRLIHLSYWNAYDVDKGTAFNPKGLEIIGNIFDSQDLINKTFNIKPKGYRSNLKQQNGKR